MKAEGTVFRDALGRHVLLRGYNARARGVFDVGDDLSGNPQQEIFEFGEAEAARFEALGLNLLRLPINWSALEPEPLQYDEAYLRNVDAVLELARAHGFYVLLDMHQDAYSPFTGQDGAPLWAVVPPPPADAPRGDGPEARFSVWALLGGLNFFANAPAQDGRPLQEAFAAAVREMVRRYVGDPVVAGYEAFNEPVLFSEAQLDAFHARFADAVLALDPETTIFFEPIVFRNQFDRARVPAAPWPHGRGAYAPHVYTNAFSLPLLNDCHALGGEAAIACSMDNAVREAEAWGTPLFVGEFGNDQAAVPAGPAYLEAHLNQQDRTLASGAAWVWREEGTWGLQDGNGNERPATARVVARPFPRATAGDLVSIARPAPGRLVVLYRERAGTAGVPHEVSASEASVANVSVLCDGSPVPFARRTGRVSFLCPPAAPGTLRTFEVAGEAA